VTPSVLSGKEERAMVTQETTGGEQVLWMADCYSLAKRFPNPQTWLSLLNPPPSGEKNEFNPFHYWLWMEIWNAAHEPAGAEAVGKN